VTNTYINYVSGNQRSKFGCQGPYVFACPLSRQHPSKLRGQLGGHVDRCLLIYPTPEWQIIQQKLMALPSIQKQARRLQRLMQGHATECEVDGNHRILVPPPLRNFAGITKHAVLIGQGNKFELWDQETWEKIFCLISVITLINQSLLVIYE